jgi:hypothetical protein
MEIADVRNRVRETIDRSKRRAAERHTRVDEASAAYARFLDRIAVPLFRQVENVLRVQGYAFTLFTPGGSVRLMSDRTAENYIELLFDASAEPPAVVGHTRRSHGRRIDEAETVVGDPAVLGEEDVLAFVLKALEPFVER